MAIVIVMVGMTALVFAAPAATAANTAKFCADNVKLQSRLDNLNNGKTFNAGDFKDAGNAFKAAAKSAPKKVKKAMGTIGSFLSGLGSGSAADYARALAGSAGKNYGKAIATWSTYVATTCD
jgi:hypothetical protein